ncbi:hypothetical protein HPB47_019192 [Ixodes persulcatus]|uniref:Uncharacterized protein n=1 Tax=Ixodes persulcatus TaxID=34615 RepID=A0AC60QIW6_IXOPE|nr:hypothetical protein HPB47_019192 [Ixodes persulcatus]
MFGRHSSTLSIVSNQVHRHIAHTFGHLLRDLTAHSWLNPDQLDVFAEAVHNQGASLTNCWKFIDGTARAMCRPTWHQRTFFLGTQEVLYHYTKYQAVMCPNGIIARLDKPYEGCRHDACILRYSGLYTDLEVLMNPKPFVFYGDPTYPHRELLQWPFGGASVTVGQATFNYQVVPRRRVKASVGSVKESKLRVVAKPPRKKALFVSRLQPETTREEVSEIVGSVLYSRGFECTKLASRSLFSVAVHGSFGTQKLGHRDDSDTRFRSCYSQLLPGHDDSCCSGFRFFPDIYEAKHPHHRHSRPSMQPCAGTRHHISDHHLTTNTCLF